MRCIALVLLGLFVGCSDAGLGRTETGALAGGGLGAGLGAIVGNQVGASGAGIAIGAAAGAIAGGLIGNSNETHERELREQEERLRRQEEDLQRQRREIQDLRREQYYDREYQKRTTSPEPPRSGSDEGARSEFRMDEPGDGAAGPK